MHTSGNSDREILQEDDVGSISGREIGASDIEILLSDAQDIAADGSAAPAEVEAFARLAVAMAHKVQPEEQDLRTLFFFMSTNVSAGTYVPSQEKAVLRVLGAALDRIEPGVR